MGEEKGLVRFHGKSFMHWILESVYPLNSNPVLVTGNPAYQKFGLEMISDLIEDKGPLGGIYTALNHSTSGLTLILSCDIPKITMEVLSFLDKKSQASPDKITFLSDGKNDYPLIGIYPKLILKHVETSILCGQLKLRQVVQNQPHQRIILNPNQRESLENINTKDQLHSLSQTY
ncbi:molybdenum cofactor guanylyltransferase [Algoriphagus boritolerans DSM 17298 = JCM 18970]|uniref:Molybdenum cofactor guanylyltransferase n=2 Tax=Algoriphagus TaxID=246875 RepID=A0A1H5WTZ9_9BACT|nr:molybdenum cofactor guanylyltransferase [Algoriphagus boritolerans DSM 17298 = JCM 18970]